MATGRSHAPMRKVGSWKGSRKTWEVQSTKVDRVPHPGKAPPDEKSYSNHSIEESPLCPMSGASFCERPRKEYPQKWTCMFVMSQEPAGSQSDPCARELCEFPSSFGVKGDGGAIAQPPHEFVSIFCPRLFAPPRRGCKDLARAELVIPDLGSAPNSEQYGTAIRAR